MYAPFCRSVATLHGVLLQNISFIPKVSSSSQVPKNVFFKVPFKLKSIQNLWLASAVAWLDQSLYGCCFTSSWSKGQGKPLKCMHVWLHWCVTGTNHLSEQPFNGVSTKWNILQPFDAFWRLSAAFLQPFYSLFAAFLQPFCSLSAAYLQPFCSLFAALSAALFAAFLNHLLPGSKSAVFFFLKIFLFYIRKVVITRRTSQLTVVLFKQKANRLRWNRQNT